MHPCSQPRTGGPAARAVFRLPNQRLCTTVARTAGRPVPHPFPSHCPGRLSMYAETAVEPALSAVAPARHWARDRLLEAGVDDGHLELLVLLVSELVTNAVAHADPPVTLRVHV